MESQCGAVKTSVRRCSTISLFCLRSGEVPTTCCSTSARKLLHIKGQRSSSEQMWGRTFVHRHTLQGVRNRPPGKKKSPSVFAAFQADDQNTDCHIGVYCNSENKILQREIYCRDNQMKVKEFKNKSLQMCAPIYTGI